MRSERILLHSLLAALVLSGLPGLVWATTPDVPYSIIFSGNLNSEATGSPVNNTSPGEPMIFAVQIGGVNVWCAEYSSVIVNEGGFSVLLGGPAQGGQALSPTSCASGSVISNSNLPLSPALFSTVTSSTPVQLVLQIYNGTSWETLAQPFPVGSSLFALQANTAQTATNATAISGIEVSPTAPATNQVLQYNGAAWTPAAVAATGPGGTSGQIQFNNSGSFGASTNFVWNGNTLGVGTSFPLTQLDISGSNTSGTLRVYDQSTGSVPAGVTQEIVQAGINQGATNLTSWKNGAGAVQASMSATGELTANALMLQNGADSAIFTLPAGGAPTTWNLPNNEGINGQVLTISSISGNTQTLSWITPPGGGAVTNVSASAPLSSSGGATPNLSLGTIGVANGGTGDTTLTAHGVLVGEGTSAVAETTAGTTGYPLVSNGASADPTFQQLGLTTGVTGTLPVANGGTGAATFTANDVLLGNGTSPFQVVAPIASGNYLRSSGTTWQSSPIVAADLPSGTLSGSGVAGYVPNYTAANVLGDSPIFVSGALVGIGTPSPATTLQVNGTVTISGGDLALPATNGSTIGQITIGGTTMMQAYGSQNFFADNAGNTTTTGGLNIAIGYQALENNTSGSDNVAMGNQALIENSNGGNNVAIGANAEVWNTGSSNTGVGYSALLYQTTGSYNVAMGYQALSGNGTEFSSQYNVAIGSYALENTSTGANNTALGYQAGYAGSANTTGINNTFIGYQAQASSGGLTNATAIGANAVVGANNSLVLGNGVNVGIGTPTPTQALQVVGNIQASGCLYYASSSLGTCASDMRLKKNVQNYTLGIDALEGLQPVTFEYNGLGGLQDDGKTQMGLIAQMVEKVAPSLVKKQKVKLHPTDKELTEIKTVDYSALTYLLINSVKDLYTKVVGIDHEIQMLKAENAELRASSVNPKEFEQIKIWACAQTPRPAFCK